VKLNVAPDWREDQFKRLSPQRVGSEHLGKEASEQSKYSLVLSMAPRSLQCTG